MHKPDHILNAGSNLLGIALVIIAGLNLSHAAQSSFADEIAWIAAVAFGASCTLSYLSIRRDPPGPRTAAWADRCFMAGLATLFLSIVVLAFRAG